MRFVARLLIPLLIVYFSLVFFTNRALYLSTYDASYWQERYEQSQWSLPLSSRIIGDDGLYLYEGYQLIHGANPALLNAEVPPLGKYLIGISIVIFGNGHIYGLITTGLLILAVYILALKLTSNDTYALLVMALVALDPLITSQYPLTMLDSFQALLLISVLIALTFINKKNILSTGLAGLLLGLFAGVKFPIFAPILAFFGGVYIFQKTKRRKFLFVYAGSALGGYMLPYVPYFLLGHTFSEWLLVQRWVVSFYRHANLNPTWGSALANLFVGRYQNIFSREWIAASHYSIGWTIASFMGIGGAARLFLRPKKQSMTHVVAGALMLFLLLQCATPFWTRYLVLLLPLMYVSMVLALPRYAKRIQILLVALTVAGNIWASVPILFPTPEATIKQFTYDYEHMFFRDIYEHVSADSKPDVSAASFRTYTQQALIDAEIEAIHIVMRDAPRQRLAPEQVATIHATYNTRRLGSFTRDLTIPVVRENGRWRVRWDWNLLFDGFHPKKTRLVTVVDEATRGALLGSDNKPLAEDVLRQMIWVTPNDIVPEDEAPLLYALEQVFDHRLPQVALHHRIVTNTSPDQPVPIGVTARTTEDEYMIVLSGNPAVSFTPAYARITHPNNIITIGTIENTMYSECCSFLYATTTYDGTSGAEQQFNDRLKGIHGGSLKLVDTEGNTLRTILRSEKRDGENVHP